MSKSSELDGTLRREWVKCGKPTCKRCAGKGHGPYWYSYYRIEGRLRKTYIGSWLPKEYEHLLSDALEPVAYKYGGIFYHKECLAELGYHGKDVDTHLKRNGILKAHATLSNRTAMAQATCGQCGKPMKGASR